MSFFTRGVTKDKCVLLYFRLSSWGTLNCHYKFFVVHGLKKKLNPDKSVTNLIL